MFGLEGPTLYRLDAQRLLVGQFAELLGAGALRQAIVFVTPRRYSETMAKRDPIETARNKRIEDMKDQLRTLLPTVLKDTGFATESSLNAKIGGKAAEFIDLKNEVIHSPTDFAAKYCEGFKGHLGDGI
jgi:hypothetical protein